MCVKQNQFPVDLGHTVIGSNSNMNIVMKHKEVWRYGPKLHGLKLTFDNHVTLSRPLKIIFHFSLAFSVTGKIIAQSCEVGSLVKMNY